MGQQGCTNLVIVEDASTSATGSSALPVIAAADANSSLPSESLSVLVDRGDVTAVRERLNKLEKTVGRGGVVREIMRCEHSAGREAKSVLHHAAATGQGEVLRLLIAANADPALPDSHGNTPLHLAALLGYARATHVLLEAGACRHSHNNFGRTPLSNAQNKPSDSAKIIEGKQHIRQMFEGICPSWEAMPPGGEITFGGESPSSQHRLADVATYPDRPLFAQGGVGQSSLKPTGLAADSEIASASAAQEGVKESLRELSDQPRSSPGSKMKVRDARGGNDAHDPVSPQPSHLLEPPVIDLDQVVKAIASLRAANPTSAALPIMEAELEALQASKRGVSAQTDVMGFDAFDFSDAVDLHLDATQSMSLPSSGANFDGPNSDAAHEHFHQSDPLVQDLQQQLGVFATRSALRSFRLGMPTVEDDTPRECSSSNVAAAGSTCSTEDGLKYLHISEENRGKFQQFAKELAEKMSAECASLNPYIQALCAHRSELSQKNWDSSDEHADSLPSRLATERSSALATLNVRQEQRAEPMDLGIQELLCGRNASDCMGARSYDIVLNTPGRSEMVHLSKPV